jgi:nitronate monooxygenase
MDDHTEAGARPAATRASWTRRDFVRAGIVSSAATVACAPLTASSPAGAPTLRTALCDAFGIRYPIFQAGMAPVAGPELAAAVCNAGGLGILAAAHMPPEEVRARIRRLRELTDKPFGVNLLLHTEVWPPIDTTRFPDDVVERVQTALNRFRDRLGIPRSSARPATRPNHVPAVIDLMHEERVPVFSVGLGNPPKSVVDRFHARGARVVAMVATVADARAVAANGVDAVIAQGSEAGGHRSTWVKPPSPQHAAIGTMVLVPQVVDAVSVPVLAAGGITDGRHVAAALMLGASGVLVGTRFIATREARAADFYKEALTRHDSDSTVVTDAYSGLYARLLRNRFIDEYTESGAPVLNGYVQGSAAVDIVRAAAARGDVGHYPMWAGQGVGMIRDIDSASNVMAALVREAGDVLTGVRNL